MYEKDSVGKRSSARLDSNNLEMQQMPLFSTTAASNTNTIEISISSSNDNNSSFRKVQELTKRTGSLLQIPQQQNHHQYQPINRSHSSGSLADIEVVYDRVLPEPTNNPIDYNSVSLPMGKMRRLLCGKTGRYVWGALAVFVLLVIVNAIAALFFLFKNDIVWYNITVFWWLMYVNVAIVAFSITFVLGKLFQRIVQSNFYIFNHVAHMQYSLVTFMWGIIMISTRPYVLKSLDAEAASWLDASLRTVILTSFAYCLRVVLQKILLGNINKKHFHKRITNVLFVQDVITRILALPPPQKASLPPPPPKAPKSKPSHRGEHYVVGRFHKSSNKGNKNPHHGRTVSASALGSAFLPMDTSPTLRSPPVHPFEEHRASSEEDLTSPRVDANVFTQSTEEHHDEHHEAEEVPAPSSSETSAEAPIEGATPETANTAAVLDVPKVKVGSKDKNLISFWRLKVNILSQRLFKRHKFGTMEEAKAIAATIFTNLGKEENDILTPADLHVVIKEANAFFAFQLLFKGKDQATLQNTAEALLNLNQERKALKNALKDRENIGKILHIIFDGLFAIAAIILILVFLFDMDFQKGIMPMLTFSFAMSFIFGPTLKDLFESIILIFFIRSFDVGDKISIDGGKTIYIVQKMYLMTTLGESLDGRVTYLRNADLFRASVQNLKRSKKVSFGAEIYVPFDTPKDRLVRLKSKIEAYCEHNSKEWAKNPLFRVNIECTDQVRLKVSIWAESTYIWNDTAKWKPAATELSMFLKECCNKLGIKPFHQTHDVKLYKMQ